jgi:Photosynthesis system II assembly factor YCF48
VSTDTDRDRSIDQLLRRAMAERVDAGPSLRCLDAETLAAWKDGGLSESERESAESHASDCVHCQAALAALARASAPPERPAAWWRRPWHLGWMVPLAAGAAAIALWVAVPNRPTPQATATRQPASTDTFDVAKPADAFRQAAGTSAAEEKREEASRAPARRDAREKELTKTERDELRSAQLSSRVAADSAAKGSVSPSTAPSPAAEQVAAAPPAPSAPRPSAAQAEVAAPVARARSAEARGQNERELAASSAVQSFRTTVLPRWRAGSAGVVQRSTDGGSTWESLATGSTSELLEVSSPSPMVCWVVGRAGAVLLTVDGRRFRRVTPPVPVDLVAVRATDERVASVTTADGRTFRTENGGTSWTEVR